MRIGALLALAAFATVPNLVQAAILPPNLSGAPLVTVESSGAFTFTVTASNPNGVPATLLDLRLLIPANTAKGPDLSDKIVGGGAGAGGSCTPLPHDLGPKGLPVAPFDNCTGNFSLLTDQDGIPENMDSGDSVVTAIGIFSDPTSPTGIASSSVDFTITVNDVSEPPALALLGVALLGLIGLRRVCIASALNRAAIDTPAAPG